MNQFLTPMWIQKEAIIFCRELEEIAPKFGAHIALTGGCLYKDGMRKDCDIIVYRIRQVDAIDRAGLFDALATIGVKVKNDYGFCVKAKYGTWAVDFLFPEFSDEAGEYPQ